MATTTTYKGLTVVSGTLDGAGGDLLNVALKAIADRIGPCRQTTSSPGVTHDGVDTAAIGVIFEVGSRWINTTTNQEYVCTDNATGAAVWFLTTASGAGSTALNTPDTLVLRSSSGGFAASAITMTSAVISATNTDSSGTTKFINLTPTYNQTATAGSTDIFVNRTETALGAGGTGHKFLDFQVATVSKFSVDNTGLLTTNGVKPTTVTTVAAAGADQGAAAALSGAMFYNITGATGSNGVRLASAATTGIQIVYNNDADNLLIYPATSQAIGAIAANSPMTCGGGSSVTFYPITAALWGTTNNTGNTNTTMTWTATEGVFSLTFVNGIITAFTTPD